MDGLKDASGRWAVGAWLPAFLVFNLLTLHFGQLAGKPALLLFMGLAMLPAVLFPRNFWKAGLTAALPCGLAFFQFYGGTLPWFTPLPENSRYWIASLSMPFTLLFALAPAYLLCRERERSHASERENAEKLDQITENILDVFWMTDPEKKKMLYVSSGYEKLWGRTRESLYEDPASFIAAIHHEDRDRVILGVLQQGQKPYDLTYRVVQPSGQVKWVRDRAFAIHDDEGKVTRICGVAMDVSDQKRAELLLQEEQTKTGDAARLSSLSALSRGVAHEVNTPLGTILLLTGELQRLAQEENVDRFGILKLAEDIEGSCRRISTTIRGLQVFSRDASNVGFSDSNLNELLDQALSFSGSRLSHHKVRSMLKLPREPLWADCRPGEILQAVVHLLLNSLDAVKSLSEERRWVELELQEREGQATIQVTDGGSGVSVEVGSQMFAPFYSSKEMGLGLGLSLAQGIAQSHSGRVFLVEGHPNTRFVFQFPLKAGETGRAG